MEQVSVANLPALVAALQQQGLKPVLLDVREPWEVAQASLQLAGAERLCIPMHQIPQRQAELDPDQPVLALCHHGMRSQQVLVYLSRHGYPRTYNIAGGIDAWSLQVDPSVPRY